MNYKKDTLLRINNVLSLIIAVYCILCCIVFTILRESPLFNIGTLGLVSGISFTLILFLKIPRKSLLVQAVVMSLFFVIFVFPRAFQYLCLSGWVNFPLGKNLQVADINRGLTYVFLGVVIIILGFVVSDVLTHVVFSNLPKSKVKKIVIFPPIVLASLFLFSAALFLYVFFALNIGHLGNLRLDNHNSLLQLLLLIFNLDVIFLIFLISLLSEYTFTHYNKRLYFVAGVIALYVLIGVIGGSRGMPLRVLSYMIYIYLCFFGNFKVNLFRAFALIIFLSILGFSFYPTANYVRAPGPSNITKKPALLAQESVNAHTTIQESVNAYATILDRFGTIDFAILALSHDVDEQAKNSFMKVKYVAENVINFLVPGDLLPESNICTSRLAPVIYGELTEAYIVERNKGVAGYFSMFYTAWGIAFLFFGWTGGLLFLFVSAFILHLLYFVILRFSGRFRYYFGCIFIICIASFYSSMGLDHTMRLAIVLFVSSVFTLLYAYAISFLIRKSPKIVTEFIY